MSLVSVGKDVLGVGKAVAGATWHTSETALKESEMVRCLNLRRVSYVT
jgi:hypothetical protein